jgi:hypothetical protein
VTYTFGGYQVSRGHAQILLDAERAAREEQEREESEREAARYRAMVIGPIQRAQYEAAREQAEIEAARQERLEERKRAERVAAAEDYRQMMLASGQSRWRTIREVLEAARAWP